MNTKPAAIDAYLARAAAIHIKLARLQQLADDHFGHNPEAIHWGHVGDLKALWDRINRKAAYSVDFDSAELVTKAVSELDKSLRVTPFQCTIQTGEHVDQFTADALKSGDGLKVAETTVSTTSSRLILQ